MTFHQNSDKRPLTWNINYVSPWTSWIFPVIFISCPLSQEKCDYLLLLLSKINQLLYLATAVLAADLLREMSIWSLILLKYFSDVFEDHVSPTIAAQNFLYTAAKKRKEVRAHVLCSQFRSVFQLCQSNSFLKYQYLQAVLFIHPNVWTKSL